MAVSPKSAGSDTISKLIAQYGCGPVKFTGTEEALYERHLLFDNIVDASQVSLRERFEAVARSVRDILSQRWIRTEQTYDRENPKRVYYLSIEFLLGRSLANNIENLLLDPIAKQLIKEKNLDWLGLLEQEPDPGLGNGGLGRLAACFLDSMATMQLPAMGYGLRYEYGMFKQSIKDGWQQERPDHWLRRPDPWQILRPQESVEVKLNCSFNIAGGKLAAPRWESHPDCSAYRAISRSSDMAAEPSIHFACGPPLHRITLTFRNSATAISLARWRRSWPPKR